MTNTLYIAEEHLRGVRADGSVVVIVVRLGVPYATPGGDWACPCDLQGLYSQLADARGVSSFQALVLALSLVRSLLSNFVQSGGRLSYLDGERELSIDTLFPRFPQ